jgi:multicomponent Na+:H+ antiporter subunit D
VTPESILLGALVLPAAGAVLTVICRQRPNLRDTVVVATSVALCLLVVGLVPAVTGGARPAITLAAMLPGVPLALRVEPLGLLFALVASGLWIATSVYSIGYLRAGHEEHQTRYFVYFDVAILAAIGVAFAGNLLTLFLFYELLTLSTYPLVTHHGTERAVRAGRVYLGVLLASSIGLLLVAVLWTWNLTGTLDFRPGGILAGKANDATVFALLALFALGTGKAALMPVHRWLPAAMVAPAPVSALLHAVAVVKAGVFTILKIVVYIVGTDAVRGTGAGTALGYVAAFSMVAAGVVALSKDNLKERLAYSTVSQLAYVVLGAALASRLGIAGGGLHIATHALGKITLFFCAGVYDIVGHRKNVSDLAGVGRRMPLTTAAFLIGALSVIGVPPLGGAWSKWLLAMAAADAGQLLQLGALLVSMLLSVGYLMPIPVRAFFSEPREAETREAPLLCLVPLCVTAAGCLAVTLVADPIVRLLRPLVE